MKKKLDSIIAETIKKLEDTILPDNQKSISEEELSNIFTQCFTEALEKTEDALMQAALYRQLSLMFHSGKLNNSSFKFKNHLCKKGYQEIPQKALNPLKELKIKRPPKFFQNFAAWVLFVITLFRDIATSEEGSQKQKTAEGSLEKAAFMTSKLYFMEKGLDRYFQPIRFLSKAIFYFFNISLLIAGILFSLPLILLQIIPHLCKECTHFLVKFVTNDEFTRQFNLYKVATFETKTKELAEALEAIGQNVPENIMSRESVNSLIDDDLKSNSLLYLKLLLLAFSHSLFKDIRSEDTENKVFFVISWPFRFIAAVILFTLATSIELVRNLLVAPLFLAFAAYLIANTVMLFVLNLPRYMFLEIPRALINWIQKPSNNSSHFPENRDDKHNLKIEYTAVPKERNTENNVYPPPAGVHSSQTVTDQKASEKNSVLEPTNNKPSHS